MKRSSILVMWSVLVVAPVLTNAHSGATGVVKERMEHMKSLGASMKTLGKIVSGQVAYDGAEVSKLATKLAEGGGEAMIRLFPKGANAHPSEAKPDIWQNWDKFQDLSHELKTQAETMAMSAQTSKEMSPQTAVRMDFMKLSGTCKSCHTEFREKKSQQ